MISIDLAKAFDTVSHQSVICMAKRLGIKCVHVLLNCLKTPFRAARGQETSNLCKFDGQIGSLAHISQEMCIKRHNKIVDMLSKLIKKCHPGYNIATEPRVPGESINSSCSHSGPSHS